MPVSSARAVEVHWRAADDHADVAASFSISRLVSGVLEGRAEQTVTTQCYFFLFHRQTEQNRTGRADMQLKKTLLAAQTTTRQSPNVLKDLLSAF